MRLDNTKSEQKGNVKFIKSASAQKKHVFILMCHVYFYFYIYDYDNRVPPGLTFQIIRHLYMEIKVVFSNENCL